MHKSQVRSDTKAEYKAIHVIFFRCSFSFGVGVGVFGRESPQITSELNPFFFVFAKLVQPQQRDNTRKKNELKKGKARRSMNNK